MSERVIENNQVVVKGRIQNFFTFSHEILGEEFYLFDIAIRRDSGVEDIVPVMISDRLIDIKKNYIGEYISITGEFRSYNYYCGERRKLCLYVFARVVEVLDAVPFSDQSNRIILEGYLCKQPVYRTTPSGREITDILIAVNRPYRKSDYIPCICWGRTARYVAGLEVADKIRIEGRVQSRIYHKMTLAGEVEERIAYEVSASAIECLQKGERET